MPPPLLPVMTIRRRSTSKAPIPPSRSVASRRGCAAQEGSAELNCPSMASCWQLSPRREATSSRSMNSPSRGISARSSGSLAGPPGGRSRAGLPRRVSPRFLVDGDAGRQDLAGSVPGAATHRPPAPGLWRCAAPGGRRAPTGRRRRPGTRAGGCIPRRAFPLRNARGHAGRLPVRVTSIGQQLQEPLSQAPCTTARAALAGGVGQRWLRRGDHPLIYGVNA